MSESGRRVPNESSVRRGRSLYEDKPGLLKRVRRAHLRTLRALEAVEDAQHDRVTGGKLSARGGRRKPFQRRKAMARALSPATAQDAPGRDYSYSYSYTYGDEPEAGSDLPTAQATGSPGPPESKNAREKESAGVGSRDGKSRSPRVSKQTSPARVPLPPPPLPVDAGIGRARRPRPHSGGAVRPASNSGAQSYGATVATTAVYYDGNGARPPRERNCNGGGGGHPDPGEAMTKLSLAVLERDETITVLRGQLAAQDEAIETLIAELQRHGLPVPDLSMYESSNNPVGDAHHPFDHHHHQHRGIIDADRGIHHHRTLGTAQRGGSNQMTASRADSLAALLSSDDDDDDDDDEEEVNGDTHEIDAGGRSGDDTHHGGVPGPTPIDPNSLHVSVPRPLRPSDDDLSECESTAKTAANTSEIPRPSPNNPSTLPPGARRLVAGTPGDWTASLRHAPVTHNRNATGNSTGTGDKRRPPQIGKALLVAGRGSTLGDCARAVRGLLALGFTPEPRVNCLQVARGAEDGMEPTRANVLKGLRWCLRGIGDDEDVWIHYTDDDPCEPPLLHLEPDEQAPMGETGSVTLRDLTRALSAASRVKSWKGRVFLVIDADRWAGGGLTLMGSEWSGTDDTGREFRTVIESESAASASADDPKSLWPLIPLRIIGRRGRPAGGEGEAADPFSAAVYGAIAHGATWRGLADGLSKWGKPHGVTPYVATGGKWVDNAGGFPRSHPPK